MLVVGKAWPPRAQEPRVSAANSGPLGACGKATATRNELHNTAHPLQAAATISERLACVIVSALQLEGGSAWPMPLPKSLRRSVRRTSSASSARTSQRKKCRTCNNLDPRGHTSSIHDAEALKEPRASLNLVVDALILSNTKAAANGGCRFCNVLVQVLDAFFGKWRGSRCRANVKLEEKGTIKVSLDGAKWENQMVEIYAGSGRQYVHHILHSCYAVFLISRYSCMHNKQHVTS
jgi:hypothetical protein